MPDLKIDILKNDFFSVTDFEITHRDCDLRRVAHFIREKKIIENMASAMTINRMLVTTARVVEMPTALGPCCVCNPRKQPTAETIAPNTTPLVVPRNTSLK